MIANLILILQLNMILVVLLFMGWYDYRQRIHLRRIAIIGVLLNTLFVALLVATDFSYKTFIQNISSVFDHVENWYRFALPVLCLYGFSIICLVYKHRDIVLIPRYRKYLVISGIFAIIASSFWIPFGLEILGYTDTWMIKHFLAEGSWVSNNASKSAEMFTRLSAILTSTIAHILTPHHFAGYNIGFIVLLFLKGTLLFGILKHFKLSDTLAVMIALLYMIYPTNTSSMSLRNFAVLSAVVMFLFSTYAFLHYSNHPTRINLFIFFVFMFVSITSNEYAFLHVLAFPILLFFYQHQSWRIHLKLASRWYVFPIWYITHYAVVTIATTSAYGTQFLSEDSSVSTKAVELVELSIHSFNALLVTNWIGSFSRMTAQHIPLIGLVILIVVGLLIFVTHKDKEQDNIRKQIAVIVVGLIIILLASTIFILTKQKDFDWRVYAIGAGGASMTVIAFLHLVINRNMPQKITNYIMSGLFVILFTLSYQSALNNLQQFYELSQPKKNMMQFANNLSSVSEDGIWIYLTDMSDDEIREVMERFTSPAYRVAGINIALENSRISNSYLCKLETDISHALCNATESGIYVPNWNTTIAYHEIVFLWVEDDGTTTLIEDFPYDYWNVNFPVESYTPHNHIAFKD